MEKIKKIGKAVYWTALPLLLIFLSYFNYMGLRNQVIMDANIFQAHALLYQHQAEVCKPRAF